MPDFFMWTVIRILYQSERHIIFTPLLTFFTALRTLCVNIHQLAWLYFQALIKIKIDGQINVNLCLHLVVGTSLRPRKCSGNVSVSRHPSHFSNHQVILLPVFLEHSLKSVSNPSVCVKH
jgi:hypothetical protein